MMELKGKKVLVVGLGKSGLAAALFLRHKGAQVTVSLQDLQEMQNDLRSQLDAGLDALRSGQGRDGLPAAPRAALTPPRAGMPGAPPAEAGVEAMLAAEQRQADQAESGLEQAAFDSRPGGP